MEKILDDIQITDLNIKDIPILNSIKPDDWPSISEVHEHYLKTTNCKSIVVKSNENEILGIGTGIALEKTGWLAHIIVPQKHQRRGIGTLIVKNRIKLLQEQFGCETITLTATEQGYPVYKNVGFTEESMYRILIPPPNMKIQQTKSENIIKIEESHLEDIFNIDRITSGEDRRKFLQSLMNNGYVYVDNGKVLGYYLPDFGDSGISAITEEAGIAFLKERIKIDRKLFIPIENETAYKFLISSGYSELKKINRMRLGKPFNRKPEYCYSRIGGFIG